MKGSPLDCRVSTPKLHFLWIVLVSFARPSSVTELVLRCSGVPFLVAGTVIDRTRQK